MSAADTIEGHAGLTRPRLTPVAFSALPLASFHTPRKIRFSDCDPAGIAYTPRLIDLMNGAVEDFFPERLGLSYYDAIRVHGVGLGYGRVDCDFFRPVSMGDAVVLSVLIDRIGAGSIAWRVHLHRADEETVRGQLVTVTTDQKTRRATPVPTWLREPLEAYRQAVSG
ncbi:thioesterase family protein [Caulobacter sp. S45]|uniref:acyl-CoA thioesterase n=1 Tax=Caulobacter sp. S45 TaxID=1641861 RepID=UPI00131B25A7|nr:thioesterase family protein [Caulobacter sp. S45]